MTSPDDRYIEACLAFSKWGLGAWRALKVTDARARNEQLDLLIRSIPVASDCIVPDKSCNRVSDPAGDLELNTIQEKLSEGAFGAVDLVKITNTKTRQSDSVIIKRLKVLAPNYVGKDGKPLSMAARQEATMDFLLEMILQSLMQCSSATAVPKVRFPARYVSGELVLVMEKMDNTLLNLLQRRDNPVMTDDQVLFSIFAQMAQKLFAMQAQFHMIHRDLHPGNVLFQHTEDKKQWGTIHMKACQSEAERERGGCNTEGINLKLSDFGFRLCIADFGQSRIYVPGAGKFAINMGPYRGEPASDDRYFGLDLCYLAKFMLVWFEKRLRPSGVHFLRYLTDGLDVPWEVLFPGKTEFGDKRLLQNINRMMDVFKRENRGYLGALVQTRIRLLWMLFPDRVGRTTPLGLLKVLSNLYQAMSQPGADTNVEQVFQQVMPLRKDWAQVARKLRPDLSPQDFGQLIGQAGSDLTVEYDGPPLPLPVETIGATTPLSGQGLPKTDAGDSKSSSSAGSGWRDSRDERKTPSRSSGSGGSERSKILNATEPAELDATQMDMDE